VSERASPTLIGAFLLGAIALIVTSLAVFGGGRFFTEKLTYVAYFPETVSGLHDGAPVNFRGVKVGIVRRIEVQLDARDLSVKIPVYLALQRKRIREVGGTIPKGDLIPELIERGLRAQLQLQSLVTGQLSVQLDILPDRPARYVDAVGEFPEMPTIPSTLHEFTQTMESLSIQDLVNDARHVLAGLKVLVNSPELSGILSGVDRSSRTPTRPSMTFRCSFRMSMGGSGTSPRAPNSHSRKSTRHWTAFRTPSTPLGSRFRSQPRVHQCATNSKRCSEN